MRRAISLLSIVTGILLVIRYRYRIANVLLSRRFFRAAAVKLAMQFPSVQKQMIRL